MTIEMQIFRLCVAGQALASCLKKFTAETEGPEELYTQAQTALKDWLAALETTEAGARG